VRNLTVGDRVMIKGERGTYVVKRAETGKDGSVLLYGGDTNPNGNRGFRSIMPERLVPDRRKPSKSKDS